MEILTGPNRKRVFMADPASPIECTGNRECATFYCTVEYWNTKTEMGKTFPVLPIYFKNCTGCMIDCKGRMSKRSYCEVFPHRPENDPDSFIDADQDQRDQLTTRLSLRREK